MENINKPKERPSLDQYDKSAMDAMRYAQGLGASLRYANELRAVKMVGRLAPLKSSDLHQDVLRGRLGPGTGF